MQEHVSIKTKYKTHRSKIKRQYVIFVQSIMDAAYTNSHNENVNNASAIKFQ